MKPGFLPNLSLSVSPFLGQRPDRWPSRWLSSWSDVQLRLEPWDYCLLDLLQGFGVRHAHCDFFHMEMIVIPRFSGTVGVNKE